MDNKFLEYLGHMFINAAKGQEQFNEMVRWSKMGFSGFEEMNALFRKLYGLDRLSEDAPDYMKLWQKAGEDFQKSMKEFLNLMGVVPKEEYLALVEKYENLKTKLSDKEETIKHLQMLLGQKGAEQGETVQAFQELMKKQSEQFMETMNVISDFFKNQTETPDKK